MMFVLTIDSKGMTQEQIGNAVKLIGEEITKNQHITSCIGMDHLPEISFDWEYDNFNQDFLPMARFLVFDESGNKLQERV